MLVNWRDAASGAIFIALGAFIAITAYTTLKVGTAFRMGPGYFPTALGILLMFIGVLVVIGSFGSTAERVRTVGWRGLVLVLGPPVIFGLTVRDLGFAPAVALVVALSSIASQRMTWKVAVGSTVFMTLFCIVIFGVLLELPLPLLGPWLTDWSN
jgi:uncharacterized membrane protein